MIKRILYLVCGLLLVVGCRRQLEEPAPKPNGGVAIGLGVDAVGDVIISNGVQSKSGIITGVMGFGEDTMAVYGVNDLSGVVSWAKDKRIIDTLGGKVNAVGRIIFSKEYKYYPAAGLLNVYALYPSGSGCVVIHDSVPSATTAPSATITLKQKASEQFDVMTGKGEGFSVAQEDRAKLKFDHALAMVKVRVYRDTNAPVANIGKLEARGVYRAKLPNITVPVFEPLVAADSADFLVYDNAAGVDVTATSVDKAITVGAPIMVFPGFESIRRIILTIDGLPYVTNIPSTLELKRGYVTNLTLRVRRFEVRLEDSWTITPWAKGDTVNSGLENNGKMIRFSVPMVNASGGIYSGAPTSAEIEINGKYTIKNIAVESVASGVVKTKLFNSGILNNQTICMTAIKLFDASGAMFDGKLYGGKLSTGQKVIIDTLDGGKLKVGNEDGAQLKLNMGFGGFGSGTADVPYEVATVLHLKNINNFKGTVGSNSYNGTAAGGAVFTQVEDIDLKNEPWTPIGTSSAALYGRYNGNGYVIRNINVSSNIEGGLFGYVATPTGSAGYAELSNITIVNGTITAKGHVGGITGYLAGRISNCYNGANVSSTASLGAYCGGIVGSVNNSSSTVSNCVNKGVLSAFFSVGGVVGYSNRANIQNCYNTGEIKYIGSNPNAGIGGLAGTFLRVDGVLQCSYNIGVVNSNIAATTKGTGGVIGVIGVGGTYSTDFRNNYYLEGVYGKGVGLNNNTMTGAVDPYEPKTADELKAMVAIFGAEWQNDYVDEPINGGYPILKWQTKAWYSKIK